MKFISIFFHFLSFILFWYTKNTSKRVRTVDQHKRTHFGLSLSHPFSLFLLWSGHALLNYTEKCIFSLMSIKWHRRSNILRMRLNVYLCALLSNVAVWITLDSKMRWCFFHAKTKQVFTDFKDWLIAPTHTCKYWLSVAFYSHIAR